VTDGQRDLQAADLEALHLGTVLAQATTPSLLVFVTGFPQHAVAAFEIDTTDCLLRPIDARRVEQVVNGFCERLEERDPTALQKPGAASDRLPVRLRERDVVRLLEREEIVGVFRKGRRTWIHTRDAEYPSYHPVTGLEAWLGGHPFLRAARGAIVNLDQVAEITHFGDRLYQLRLKDRQQTEVRASRSAASLLSHHLRPHLEDPPDSRSGPADAPRPLPAGAEPPQVEGRLLAVTGGSA
jgi:DNA-binding LytR/AlgR family response regulator